MEHTRTLLKRVYFLNIVSTMLALLVLFNLVKLYLQLASGDAKHDIYVTSSSVCALEAPLSI